MLTAVALPAAAQPYPAKPVSIVVGLQAGTGSDVAVRWITEKMSASMGQPFVVENLAGAAGLLAAQAGAKAPPDGYRLVALSSAAVTTLPHVQRNMTFDPQKELMPVGVFVSFPSVLSVTRNVPVKSVREYIEYAKKNPGKLTYASGGNGSVQHLAMETLKWMAGIDVLHVPYKGMAQATNDLVGGQVDSAIQGVVAVVPFIKSGQVRPLAWTGAKRNALLPEIPTLHEAGITGYDYQPWTALFAPDGTPREVVARLSGEMRKAGQQKDVQERFASQVMELLDVTPQQLEKMIHDESRQMAELVKKINLRMD
jgi:tripartite-type tricarboxylate transporter receptor subunit TctC